ncbi:MAG: hypothetical protein MJ079_02270 [Ruminococcus sp.]|nr:hypothetical protein [Ruminococcus sp.]
MDIKAKIEEIIDKVKNDKDFAENFKKDPVKAVEGVVGVDLPDDEINKIVDGVKAKNTADGIGGKINSIIDKIKG